MTLIHQGPLSLHLHLPQWLLPPNKGYSALTVSATTTAAYFLFYSAYNKTNQRIELSLLLDIFLFRRGVDWSLKEINKTISLSGITTLLLSLIPEFAENYVSSQRDLFFISMNLLWVHSAYSFWKFYDANPCKVLEDKWMKRLSVWLGGLGQIVLALGYWDRLSLENVALFGTVLSIGHFVTMELDFKYKLQVRPFAYLPFPLGAAAIYKYFFP